MIENFEHFPFWYNQVNSTHYTLFKVFVGNTDTSGIVYNWLDAPTEAHFVRFRATDVEGSYMCVGLEFYGSRDSQGMVGLFRHLFSMFAFSALVTCFL